MLKFWKKKIIGDGITRTENINRNFNGSNTSIAVASGEAGIVQLHVDSPDPVVAEATFYRVYEAIKKDVHR